MVKRGGTKAAQLVAAAKGRQRRDTTPRDDEVVTAFVTLATSAASAASLEGHVVTAVAGVRTEQGTEHYSWDGTKPGATIAEVAVWLNYGTEKMPARPYMSRAVAEYRKRLRDREKAYKAKSAEDAMRAAADAPFREGERMSHLLARMIHREIQTAPQWATPLAERTVEAKGHGTPLHDTESLATSIGWEVSDGTRKRGGLV